MSEQKTFGLNTVDVFETASRTIKHAKDGLSIMEQAFHNAVHAAYLKGYSDAKKGMEYDYESIRKIIGS